MMGHAATQDKPRAGASTDSAHRIQGSPFRAPPMLGALLLLAVAAAMPIPTAAQQTLTINVIEAVSIDCSTDQFTRPDLRVTVLVDGKTVLQTAKAQDRAAPLFAAAVTVPSPGRTVPLLVRVEEAEPALFTETWVHCDVAPGGGKDYAVDWSGQPLALVTRGDAPGERAEAVVVVGTSAPPAPTVRIDSVGTDFVTIGWDGNTLATGHRVAWGRVGPVVASGLAAQAGTHTVPGLCDNTDYLLRVIRDADPWHVASADLSLRTENAPPQRPRVLSATPGTANLEVRWESPTQHDVASFEAHVGDAVGYEPSAGTRIGSTQASPRAGPYEVVFSWGQSSPAFVKVVAIDNRGLRTASEAFAVGSPAREGTVSGLATCGEGRTDLPMPTQTGGPTGSTTATTPTTATSSVTTSGGHNTASQTSSKPPKSSDAPIGLIVGGAILVLVLLLAVVVLVARR